MILHIELQDMKPRYQHVKFQKKRTNAFIKSLELSSGLRIIFCVKECMIIEFTLQGGQGVSKEAQKNVRELIQGEICSVSIYPLSSYKLAYTWCSLSLPISHVAFSILPLPHENIVFPLPYENIAYLKS